MTPFIAEWARCQPWLAAALARGGGTHTVDDVLNAVLAGRMQFWPGERSVLVTEIVTYPRLKAVRVFAGGGEANAALGEMLALERHVADFGRANGCQRIEGFGREGWARALRRLGYADTRVFMWRAL
ncbi:MAG TPA: hypothetical protein VD995_04660 [Azospirillum sp.]|nr:hypothetical protein [Azospirillum sp.]